MSGSHLFIVVRVGGSYFAVFFCHQGPLPHTVPHFWQMIWEQESVAIIMLNRVIEKNQVGI